MHVLQTLWVSIFGIAGVVDLVLINQVLVPDYAEMSSMRACAAAADCAEEADKGHPKHYSSGASQTALSAVRATILTEGRRSTASRSASVLQRDRDGSPAEPAPAEVTELEGTGPPTAASCIPIERDRRGSAWMGFYFARNSTKPSGYDRIRAGRLVEELADRPHVRLLVRGHTDGRGLHSYNVTLARLRAESIVSQLVAQGFPQERIEIEAMADACPLSEHAAGSEQAWDRRVEVHWK